MKVATEISLSLKEKQQLRKNINSRTTPIRLVERSKIVLLGADGLTNQAIAKKMNIPPNKVGRWRNRFAEGRMKAIVKDKPRGNNQGGKSAEEQAHLRQEIITMTTQEKPNNATHWSTRTLAEVLNTTHSFVHRVWQSVGLKPHLEKTFKVSNDKHFEENYLMWLAYISHHLKMRLYSVSTRRHLFRR